MSSIASLDTVGLFILLAGFIIGLGSVTVIDFHGFLGRNSSYWTEATTRTHKVTKPLIWFGIVLTSIGGYIFYRDVPFGLTQLFHISSLAVLILNGYFLSFKVSPFLLQREVEGKSGELLSHSWQQKITMSFIVSFILWWSNVAVLVIYLTT